MDLENLWYELSPYVYAVFGFVVMFHNPASNLLKASGLLLIAAALTIIRLRWVYRRAVDLTVETTADFMKQSRDKNQGLLWEED